MQEKIWLSLIGAAILLNLCYGGLLTKQKVYLQRHSITDYLYKYDLPAMDDFTYCMWLNMADGLENCFPVSIATSTQSNQHLYGWEYMHTSSGRSRVVRGSVLRDNSLSNELRFEIQNGWHKHCFVNKKDEYIKWFMDRTTTGVLEEIETGDSLSTIPSGSALLLLQDQDAFKGGLDPNQVCISNMSMFNLWDTALTVEGLNALGCKDQGNVLNMDNLDYMGETPEYVTEEFNCTGCSLDEDRAKLKMPIWLEGPAAPTVNGGVSEIKCPDGYYVKICFPSIGVMRYGAKIIDSQTCQALNSGKELYTDFKAVVQCQPRLPLVLVTTYLHDVIYENQVVRCPDGHVLDECVGYNPWSRNGTYTIIRVVNGCSWRTLSGRKVGFMRITIVCLEAFPLSSM